MDYTKPLKYHFKPKTGWINDPNGLVYFNGYYHLFYQHCPHYEIPWQEPVYWGHARTTDFINFEELPFALCPESEYDAGGCWSGTAIVKDEVLYLFYASINTLDDEKMMQTISVAYSTDGINFEKYEGNPIIDHFPPESCRDFRDPAVAYIDGKYYCIVATGNYDEKTARLISYESDDLLNWKYHSVMKEWKGSKFAECPSVMDIGGRCLVASSVCNYDDTHFFSIMYGSFDKGSFTPEISGNFDAGPDQYAGQVFRDRKGRNILITWIPGWKFSRFAEKDVGCLSLPREIIEKDGKIYGYPIEEVRHLLKDSDDAVRITDDGFIIERKQREPIIHKGKINDIKIMRDEYIIEVFINGGETVYSALLC